MTTTPPNLRHSPPPHVGIRKQPLNQLTHLLSLKLQTQLPFVPEVLDIREARLQNLGQVLELQPVGAVDKRHILTRGRRRRRPRRTIWGDLGREEVLNRRHLLHQPPQLVRVLLADIPEVLDVGDDFRRRGGEQGAEGLQERGGREHGSPLGGQGAEPVDGLVDGALAFGFEGGFGDVGEALGAVEKVPDDGSLGVHLGCVGLFREVLERFYVGVESEARGGRLGALPFSELAGELVGVVADEHVARVELAVDGWCSGAIYRQREGGKSIER